MLLKQPQLRTGSAQISLTDTLFSNLQDIALAHGWEGPLSMRQRETFVY